MESITSKTAFVSALIGGAAFWQATATLTGRREAWDSPTYWMVAYPLGLLLAGVLAHLNPNRPWRWALAMMLVQAVVMTFSGSDYSLLPLGLIMFGVLAVPPIGVATIVGAMRRRQAAS